MKQRLKTITKTCLILILVVLVGIMMIQIGNLQGTAKVLNYAGLVRGATQREVKLEITGTEDDELIQYLDDILYGLRFGGGTYKLTRLSDKDYRKKLKKQVNYWNELKKEILLVREKGYQKTDIVEMSEIYFNYADETVTAAENYSEKIERTLHWVEIFSIADMIALLLMILEQTMTAIKIRQKNQILEKKAYIDLHTGLPNKSRCEEFLQGGGFVKEPTACVMVDINNLKLVNDNMGHAVGDQLITNFARLLQNSVPSKDFVGRYGGDEFIIIIDNATREYVEEILAKLQDNVDKFNETGKYIRISYACGWALSSDYAQCTIRTLFDKADKYMYENKKMKKEGRLPERK